VSDSLQRLSKLLRAEGGLIADLLIDEADRANGGGVDAAVGPGAGDANGAVGPAQIAAGGPRADGRGAEYELLIETIYEGYLLHYHLPRVVRAPERDLGLLAGDRLYALGLARLVRLGDVDAVAELADVIALSALAHGADNPRLASAVWDAGARAVGWGPTAPHERAKALARAGSPDALAAMRALAGAAPRSG
jgi:hypothetical protein